MRKFMTGSKNIFGKMIILAFALSMCAVTPVYAVEETQQVVEQEEGDQQEPGEGEEDQEQTEETSEVTNTTTTRTTSGTGNIATTAASTEASDESLLEATAPDLEITNGLYTLTLTKNANMRAEPSTEASSRIVIPFGMTLDSNKRVVNGTGEIWYEVTYATLTGYIREDLADIETLASDEPQPEDAEGQEEEVQEENADEAVAGAAGEASTETAVTPHSVINSDRNDQSEAASEASLEATQTDETVKVKRRKKFDFVVLLFLAVAGIGVALVVAVVNLLRSEVKRTRDRLRKQAKREQASLFQNIEE